MKLAKYIDHTILNADATQADVDKVIEEAIKYDFASVCINPYWVSRTAAALKDSTVNTCTVIGFPLGATSTASKVFEAQQAIKDGADELDMVINIGELKAKHNDAVEADIKALADAIHAEGKLLKVIIETSLLTDEEKVRACELSEKAGADFVKTSTGFSTAGAKVPDVALMRKTVGDRLGVQASGGVHSTAEAEAMIDAGATRIGARARVKIVTED